MQPNVPGTPPVVEPDIQKMRTQTKLNHDADEVESVAIRFVAEQAGTMKEVLRIVVASATELAILKGSFELGGALFGIGSMCKLARRRRRKCDRRGRQAAQQSPPGCKESSASIFGQRLWPIHRQSNLTASKRYRL